MNHLPTLIEGHNRNAKHIKTLWPLLVEWLKPFVGKKIYRVDGSLVKKLSDTRPDIGEKSFRWYLNAYTYSVYLEFDTCVSRIGESYGCEYAKQNAHLCKLNEGVLEELEEEAPDLKDNWSLEEIQKVKAEVRALKEKIAKKESEIHLFT